MLQLLPLPSVQRMALFLPAAQGGNLDWLEWPSTDAPAAEEGRAHAAKVLASQLSQFIAMTATSLMDEGTLEAEAREAARQLFEGCELGSCGCRTPHTLLLGLHQQGRLTASNLLMQPSSLMAGVEARP